jgi:hypothetical protein
MRGSLLVVAAGTRRRAAELGRAGSAQCGRTVWIAVRIAVVRMQDDWRRSIPIHGIGPDPRLMTNRVRKRERAGEHERRGYCYCRKFHGFVLRVLYEGKVGLLFDHPTKFLFKRDRSCQAGHTSQKLSAARIVFHWKTG